MTEPPVTEHLPIHEAIPRIIGDLPAIGKDSKMTEGPARYDYRGIEDIMPHVRQLFARYGVHIAPMFEVLRDEGITINSKPWNRVVLQGTFRFGANDGSYIVARTIGEARDNSDKAYNKAMTAAYKYAITQVLAIGGDDPDAYHPGSGEAVRPGAAEPVRYPNFDALKALGPALKAADLAAEVKMFAEAHHIDMRPGHDEDGLALVLAEVNRRLAEVAAVAPAAVTTVVNNTITAPPPVPDTDMVTQARRELDEVLAAHADDAEPGVPADSVDPEVAEAAEDEALARIMEQFGPGTEVVDD